MSDLRQAAQAVLNRWDSPNWEWKHYGSPRFLPTATLMSALRKALAEQQAEPVHGDIRALKYRIHELEGEVMGYKRMLDVAEAASQRKPLTDEEIYECERIAAMGYQKHVAAIRGQQFTAADDPQWHFVRAIEAAHHIQEPKS